MTYFGLCAQLAARKSQNPFTPTMRPAGIMIELSIEQCSQCQQPLEERDGSEAICYDCRQLRLFNTLPTEVQREIDELIYAKRILEGVLTLKQRLGISLGYGNLLYSWRYSELRKFAPSQFSVSHEEYWEGFFS